MLCSRSLQWSGNRLILRDPLVCVVLHSFSDAVSHDGILQYAPRCAAIWASGRSTLRNFRIESIDAVGNKNIENSHSISLDPQYLAQLLESDDQYESLFVLVLLLHCNSDDRNITGTSHLYLPRAGHKTRILCQSMHRRCDDNPETLARL